MWFLPYAIACGNTFILKPSERVPLSMKLIVDLIAQTGLPKGVMNMVNGGKPAVTRYQVLETFTSPPEFQMDTGDHAADRRILVAFQQ